jgi:hypothetical protein
MSGNISSNYNSSSESESNSSGSSSDLSSVESLVSFSEPSTSSGCGSYPHHHQYSSPSMATIAAMYNFPPLPPPPPLSLSPCPVSQITYDLSITSTDELSAKFSAHFTRRCETHTSLYPASSLVTLEPQPCLSPVTPRCGRSLLKPGTEGKLLVPNVKLKAHGVSSARLSSWTGTSYSASLRHGVKSPLSQNESQVGESINSRDVAFNAPSVPNMESQCFALFF